MEDWEVKERKRLNDLLVDKFYEINAPPYCLVSGKEFYIDFNIALQKAAEKYSK
jgi:hypothetical protein